MHHLLSDFFKYSADRSTLMMSDGATEVFIRKGGKPGCPAPGEARPVSSAAQGQRKVKSENDV